MSNFEFLQEHDDVFYRLANNAERAFSYDPNTTLIKLRQLGEAFAQDIASRLGIEFDRRTAQIDLIKKLQYQGDLQREITDTFHYVRKTGNDATHQFTSQNREAIQTLRLCWTLASWYHRTFGNPPAKWSPGKFVTPEDPAENLRKLEEQISALQRAQAASQQQLKTKDQLVTAEAKRAVEAAQYAQKVAEERDIWEQTAQENEDALVKAQKGFDLATSQRAAEIASYAPGLETLSKMASEPAAQIKAGKSPIVEQTRAAIKKTAWEESEKETRLRIDQQLRDALWQADTENLRYSKGARPEAGVNKAIAEWPTSSGQADYVLFIGLKAYAVVEAKKTRKEVSADLEQAQRYARDIEEKNGIELLSDSPWIASQHDASLGSYLIPFAFATNGRPYLNQHKESSGVWFRDLRRPQNHGAAMDGWYSPQGLIDLHKQDLNAADQALVKQNFDFDFKLRPYQVEAVQAVEQAIINDQQQILVAMATGTGKTKTCIALLCRLLNAKRFRRILFLVDRSALGEQTVDAFDTTQLINQQSFADIFNIKGMDDVAPDTKTRVQVATVQGMVQRILYSDTPPTVDQYDCIVVDECHRGYLLDRELNDSELKFRSEKDYISKYRRVLDYFNAVKVGLTATPALHTAEIFGEPIYFYSYAEAVIDGYLIDQDPPLLIKTDFNEHGISYSVNEQIAHYNVETGELNYSKLEDEVTFETTQFNRKIEVESFNKVICDELVNHLDPLSEEKTLIYCCTDRHADMVVRLLKQSFTDLYGECEDSLIQKITGSIDKPLEHIRRFKNERLPNIAVTVDLLTTGIDVPAICNLVFLRRVKSRILYEQMKGRATRLCPEIKKDAFRIFDAVDLYSHLEAATNMKPVVVNPSISFGQLVSEVANEPASEHKETAREQLLAKLQRKKQCISDKAKQDFEVQASMSFDSFIEKVQQLPVQQVADWFIKDPELGELLDARDQSKPPIIFISDKPDTYIETATGYGKHVKPDDYLQAFETLIKARINDFMALQTVVRQPGKITRAQIKEVLLALEQEQFTEKHLRKAWAMKTKKDVAARIVGYIRQAALGDALVPWSERVDNALAVILAQQDWKPVQARMLNDIGELLKSRIALDPESIDNSHLSRQGGYKRINKLFDDKLEQVLEAINDALWEQQQQS